MRKLHAPGVFLALVMAVSAAAVVLAGEVEPGGGSKESGGGAALSSVQGNRATVNLIFHAMTERAVATITPVSVTEKGELLGSAGAVRKITLPAGVELTLPLSVHVAQGARNFYQFRVDLNWPDGTASPMNWFLEINLDPAREPRLVGNVLEFEAMGVKP